MGVVKPSSSLGIGGKSLASVPLNSASKRAHLISRVLPVNFISIFSTDGQGVYKLSQQARRDGDGAFLLYLCANPVTDSHFKIGGYQL